MAGGALTGALIMAFDVTLKAPHGGIFVFFAIGKLAWFLVALAAGTVVGALAVIAAKQLTAPVAPQPPKPPFRRERSSKNHHYVEFDEHPKEHRMPSKTVTVGSAVGLHARPAAVISEAVVNSGVPVTLAVEGGDPVDAGSALMIMTLGAGKGAQVVVTSDDEAVLAQIAGLVEQDLDA